MTLEANFANFRQWVVVGVSADRTKYGNIIFRQLLSAGYKVQAVNPKLTTVEENPCYANLKALPTKPDVVNVVLPPALGVQVVEDCLALGINNIWFQPGAESGEAIAKAKAGGLNVLANACILLTHRTWAE
jgi:predicted CoA-binding protein